MKLKYIQIWFDCPQIRWETERYKYVLWLWMRRNGQWPNTYLYFSRSLPDMYWEDNWEKEYIPEKGKYSWCLWREK